MFITCQIKLKKYIAFFSLSLFVFISSCGSPAGSAPKPPRFTDGKIADGKYVNDVLGIDVPVPANWIAKLSSEEERSDTFAAVLVKFLSSDSTGPFRATISILAGATNAQSMNCQVESQAMEGKFGSDSAWSNLAFASPGQVHIGEAYACDNRFTGDYKEKAGAAAQHLAIRQATFLCGNYVVVFTLADTSKGFSDDNSPMDKMFEGITLHSSLD